MSWYLFTANHTAHIQPTLTSGTELAGFKVGNVRTPAVNVRSQISSDVTNGVQIDWDRGTPTNLAAVDTVLVLANQMTTATLDIVGDTVSNFASPTELLSTSTHSNPDFFRRLAATSTEQYLRFDYQNTSGGTFKYGLIAIGRSFALPSPQIATENHRADGDQRIRTQSFRMVTRTNAESIIDHMDRHYIWTESGTPQFNLIDAIGGRQTPIALIDDGDAAGSETVYYGRARVTARPSLANHHEVTVEMNVVREGLFL